jgi:hypothetical protein
MINIFWGPFALGVFVGMVGATTALLAFVVVEYVEYELFHGTGKDGKMMKDFFDKPIKVVTTCDIRPGDYIHDIADPASLIDIEKRRGYVISIASQIEPKRIVLRLTGRRTLLEVPADANAVITQDTLSATPVKEALFGNKKTAQTTERTLHA